jgi:glycosyltransferase involved in cell wall biosynthesis
VRQQASRLIVVGRDMKEKLVSDGVPEEKIVFVPAWATQQPVDRTEIESIRREMDWLRTRVVMHAGNMGLAQNLDVVLESAERLRDEDHLSFVFLGDGAAKPRLMAESQRRGLSNIQFLPYRPRLSAQAIMAAADLHIVSLVPGLCGCAAPSKTYSVMAAGRPFVAAVDEGAEPARIIEEFSCGRHVLAGDSEGLSQAIVEILRDDPDELGRQGLKAFHAHYTRQQATSAIQSVLEQAAVQASMGPTYA